MLRIAKAVLLLLVFSLPFTKHGLMFGGLQTTATDGFFLVVASVLAGSLGWGEARLRWSNAFIILIIYFAAMLISALFAGTLFEAMPKLSSQLYLLSLPVFVYALINDCCDLRRVFRVWLAGTAVTTAIGVVTVLLFVAGIERAAIDYALHGFGTLPPGSYPRLESTFSHPAMLCNYLTVSLAILLISLHLKWVGRAAGYALIGAILVTAAFTITPGLGGIAALLGAWLFVKFKTSSRPRAMASLAMGSALAVGFFAVSAVTPILHPTAPFLINITALETPLAPSVRLMAWIEAAKSVLDNPVFGTGIGSKPISIDYVAPSRERHSLTDAHNVYLNVAMHNGLFGLTAILLLIGFVACHMRPLHLTDAGLLRFGLGFAWLNAFAYQGLTGSYEDARHLWLLLGLLLVAIRLEVHQRADRAT